MKKYKSISLIETLISLTIVGISVMALLPVMTVHKDADDPSRGNRFWECGESCNAYYPAKNGEVQRLAIGNPEYPGKDSADKLFEVDATGFKNRNIVPLFVKDRLLYDNQVIITDMADKNKLQLSGGTAVDATQCSSSIAYPKNIYIETNGVIIQNQQDSDNRDNFFCKSNSYHDDTISVGKKGIYKATEPTMTIPPVIDDRYVLDNNNKEYLYVDKTYNIIGIGQNAAKFINLYNNDSSHLIIIGNNPSTTDPGNNVTSAESGIYIGYKGSGYNGYSEAFNPDDFVISKKYKTNDEVDETTGEIHKIKEETNYKINANLKADGGFTAGRLVLASDKRLKDVIGDYKKGLNEIKQIKPVEFTYKNDEKQFHHIGVIAQDLQKIFPESVGKNPENGYLNINTDATFYALLNSIKELNKKNQIIKQENDKIEEKIAELKKIRDNLRTKRGGQND